MRHAFVIGLSLLLTAGCADKPAPQDTARAGQAVPIDPAGGGQPTAGSVSDQPLPQLVPADGKPIPQDIARMEKRRRERLEWNRRTIGGAYEKVGKKDPKWDKPAREAMDLAARMFGLQLDPSITMAELHLPAKAAVAAGCDDPLLVYLYSRSAYGKDYPGPEETIRRVKAAGKALSASRYPAIRRAIALQLAGTHGLDGKNPSDAAKKEAEADFDASLALLPASIKDDEHTEFWEDRWLDTINDLVRGYRALGMAPLAAYKRVDDELAKVPEFKVPRLQYRGKFWLHYGWEARTQAFAPSVPEGGFESLEQRLAVAKKACEEAWMLRPDDARTAQTLLAIDKSIGGDRATMELWFDRAMKADGDDREACWSKLDWLDPKWYGDDQGREMLAFGRQCRDTKNWRPGISLLVADAHWRIACKPGEDQNKYLALPEVWADIQSVYDEYFKHHPVDDVARSKFATFCYLSAHYREAEVQYVALEGRLTQWTEFPFVPLGELKQNRERNARIVLGKEGMISFPGWHFLRGTNDAGEWYINAPASLQHQKKPGTLGVDQSYTWNCSAGGITYELRMQDIPDSRSNELPERVLDADRSDLAKQRGAEARNLRNTLLAVRPAQEYDVDLPGPKSMRVKTIIIGAGIYELSVTGSRSDITGRAAREFFDSFAFQTKAK
jgi:hypothetical protein